MIISTWRLCLLISLARTTTEELRNTSLYRVNRKIKNLEKKKLNQHEKAVIEGKESRVSVIMS